jgi:hypothetical protein
MDYLFGGLLKLFEAPRHLDTASETLRRLS